MLLLDVKICGKFKNKLEENHLFQHYRHIRTSYMNPGHLLKLIAIVVVPTKARQSELYVQETYHRYMQPTEQ